MPNRRAVLLILLAGISLVAGCKKSSESDAPNFFGTPPVVSEVSITKVPKHFHCIEPVTALCCVGAPWPLCDCCCPPATGDDVLTVDADLDLVEMSAKVTDAEGTSNLLVVLARFFDPPTTSGTTEISLEMFDTGGNPVGTIASGGVTYNVISGDASANDGVYTRFFYMRSDTIESTGNCILSSDAHDNGGTYSEYRTTSTFPATQILNYSYHIEAVDRAGNVTPSPATTVQIVKTTVTNARENIPCGPSNGIGGCEPPTP